MKNSSGGYGVLPGRVRYSPTLSDGAKLLYAELTAMMDENGRTPYNLTDLGARIGKDRRTVLNYVEELRKEHFVSWLSDPTSTLVIPIGFSKLVPKSENSKELILDDDVQWMETLIKGYEDTLGITINRHDIYYPILNDRLTKFSRNEIETAVKNRLTLLSESEYHKDNISTTGDIMLVIGADSKLVQSLNMKIKKGDDVVLKPLKYE